MIARTTHLGVWGFLGLLLSHHLDPRIPVKPILQNLQTFQESRLTTPSEQWVEPVAGLMAQIQARLREHNPDEQLDACLAMFPMLDDQDRQVVRGLAQQLGANAGLQDLLYAYETFSNKVLTKYFDDTVIVDRLQPMLHRYAVNAQQGSELAHQFLVLAAVTLALAVGFQAGFELIFDALRKKDDR